MIQKLFLYGEDWDDSDPPAVGIFVKSKPCQCFDKDGNVTDGHMIKHKPKGYLPIVLTGKKPFVVQFCLVDEE